ncbi:hypothetical protein SFRURICE_008984 [Spodoptera frugiperda]|nr:hypothetical protein SFRURICE_008984 [Spodoptera frugiperda]
MIKVLFNQNCAMLHCCRSVQLPPIISIHSLVVMRAIDGFPTIDTSHTRDAHLPRTATKLCISGNSHIVSRFSYYNIIV